MDTSLSALSDSEILRGLHQLVFQRRHTTARIIAHLVEVQARRLYAKMAFSSLFDFCRRHLGMSEGSATRYMTAARVALKFPDVIRRIEKGEVHLSSLLKLQGHLTEQNSDLLLEAANGKTVRQVEELIARIAPRPDVPTKITEIPDPKAPTTGDAGVSATNPSTVNSCTEPLSESRYKLQLTIDGALLAELQRVTELMRHRNPSGDVAVVLEYALGVARKQLEKERFAKTARPRRPSGASRKRGYVPAAVTREVYERDGYRCTYEAENGDRCPATTLLELDHIESRALGGLDDAANLRVRCREHNMLYALQVFGPGLVPVRHHYRSAPRSAGVAGPPPGDAVTTTSVDQAARSGVVEKS